MKTPQTDDLARGNHVVPTEWAEQLERERNEARKQVENQKVRIGEFFSALEKLTSERDKLKQLLAADSENVDAYLGVCIERDEAREIAQQLIHIASHCLGWHENANPETITEAIKRWNASTKK
jgi:hypothetical protein